MNPPIPSRQRSSLVDEHLLSRDILPHHPLQHLAEPGILHKRRPVPANVLGSNGMEEHGRGARLRNGCGGRHGPQRNPSQREVQLWQKQKELFC